MQTSIKRVGTAVFRKSAKRRNRAWTLMVSIPLIFLVIFKYIPMAGIIIAFKKYRFSDGIFGSKWVGFDNFKVFLRSHDLWILLQKHNRL